MNLLKILDKKFDEHEHNILLFITFIGLGIMFFSGMDHFNGFHNVDLAYNMKFVETLLPNNMTIVDIASDFESYTYDELYIIGSNQMDIAFTKGVIAAIAVGFGLGYVFSRWKK